MKQYNLSKATCNQESQDEYKPYDTTVLVHCRDVIV